MMGRIWLLLKRFKNLEHMKQIIVLVAFLISLASFGQEDLLVQGTIKGVLAQNQDKVIQLAEAFSEAQYNWRPMDGVLSVGEALTHIAAANYFLATKMGFPPPEDVDVMQMGKITGKDNIIAAVKRSNAFVLEKITQVENAKLDEEVDFGFMKMSKLGGLLAMMEHNGEHKGQLIAYARSNEVVPPWSVQQ